MDPRIHQLIAAARLQDDLRAAKAAGGTRRRFLRPRPVPATHRFLRRSQSSIPADR
jgi:hypothetical protein